SPTSDEQKEDRHLKKKAKGKKEGKQESKADKESDVEKAKANAALWELRLQVTGQSLTEYQEACHKLARANEQLTGQLYRAEKDAIDITGHWQRQLAAREEKWLFCLYCKLFRQLEGAMYSAFKERDRLNEALKYHVKESQDLHKLTNSLAKENTSLALNKDMLQMTVKKNEAQMEAQNQRLSELRAKVVSLEKALVLKAGELELQEKKEKMNLVTIQASQVELEKLQNVLAMREKELGHIKQLASTIVEKRRELEEFFHEALAHVKQEIEASRLQYKKEALQGYRWRFREATAGKIKFPPIRTFHKSLHSTNSVYSDMEAAVTWTHPPGSKVQISDLTWEQKEQVLRLLFAKMNRQRERAAWVAPEKKPKALGATGSGEMEVKGGVTGCGTCIHAQSLGTLHQLRQPAPRLTHQDGCGQSHAALSRCPERCAHKLVQSVLLVGIRHHHTMVLGSLQYTRSG
uniref:Basal body orientation factor 1 n=1 Tax=Stegastes partitus TaxID=144197 RepID=A0A3B4ZY84_9TELE